MNNSGRYWEITPWNGMDVWKGCLKEDPNKSTYGTLGEQEDEEVEELMMVG